MVDGYTFYGTSIAFDENVLTKGYEPFFNNSQWEKDLNKHFSPTKNTIYLNLYTKNITSLIVNICGSDGNRYQKKFEFSKNGYQTAIEWSPDSSSKVSKEMSNNQYDQKLDSNPHFFATIELKNSLIPYKFVVGDAKIYEKHFVKKPSKGFLFHELTGKKENKLSDYIRRKFGDAYPFKQHTDLVSFKGSPFSFELEADVADSIAIQKSTLLLIRSIFQKYPFFEEHRLDKETVIDSIDKIINNSLSFQHKIRLIEREAKKLHDGHFYFQTTDKKQLGVSSPLILKKINGSVQVVGIRDDRLDGKIELGDIVQTVDNISCDAFVDSLSNNYFGNHEQRKELAISHLLENPMHSSPRKITLKKPNGNFYSLELIYDKRFSVPKRFVPEHFGFKQLNDGWVYLKINKWDPGDWIKFLNLKDSIKNSAGIVFDIRGNPGGFEIESIKILSSFVKTPFLYSTQAYSMPNEVITGETIVQPNKFLDLSKLKTIIMVDNKTGCASESFALALKKIHNATIVGTSKTGGAYSTVYSFLLPQGIQLWTNVLGKSYMLDDKTTIESTGIKPDINVEINKYTDLYGYEDKVLKTVQKLIDRSIHK